MPFFHFPRPWTNIASRDTTDPSTYAARRQFIRTLGLGSIAVAAGPLACQASPEQGLKASLDGATPGAGPLDKIPENAPKDVFPVPASGTYTVPERPLTERLTASSYNNFYEFKHQGDLKTVWPLVDDYEVFPMTLEVAGEVDEPQRFDIDTLIRSMPLEERTYRFRCVEAWSMTVPWTGFPLSALIRACNPNSRATHVRFTSVNRPDQMPGIANGPWYPWPYFEGLRMDEAMNDLAFVAVGMYGAPLPKQNGAPLRVVLPWKYGYKGPKAVVKIEFVRREPQTFWQQLQPTEYPFLSNVDPSTPHPRWSQATEKLLVSTTDVRRIATQPYNGYGAWVADLYR